MFDNSINFINPNMARQILIDYVNNNDEGMIFEGLADKPVKMLHAYQQGLTQLDGSRNTLYWYYVLHYNCLEIALKELDVCSNRDIDKEIFNAVFLEDTYKALIHVALVAWLTTDDFRWHYHYPDVPEDLSYGLILSYPTVVSKVAAYVLNMNRNGLLKDIPIENLNKIRQAANLHYDFLMKEV